MSSVKRGNAGIVGVENNPTTSVASGIWDLNEVLEARKNNLWPTMSLYNYPIEHSLRFDGSSYLSKSSLGSASTFTFSMWAKISSLDENKYVISWDKGAGLYTGLAFATPTANSSNSPNSLYFYNQPNLTYTTQAYRDLSGYYHIVWSSNNLSSTLYVNSNSVLSSVTTPALNSTIYLGKYAASTSYNFNGYLADIYFIDGQALSPYFFGELVGGVWTPKAFDGTASDGNNGSATGSYGTNGFHLQFNPADFNTSGGNQTVTYNGNSSTLPNNHVADVSGSGNHWELH